MLDYEEFKKAYSLNLNQQQETAVKAVEGPVLLLAVPGSGKTTVLVSRLGYMIFCRGIDRESILTMTYTVNATKDMRRRFETIFGKDSSEGLEFRTINGVSARIINRYEKTLNRNAFQLITDESVSGTIISDIYRAQTEEYPTESDIKAVRTAITYIKNMMLAESEIMKLEVGDLDILKFYREYCKQLREKSLMDYDDQLVYAYKILKTCPDILEYFRDKYRYICVDEAQDTSKIQHEIINLLAQGSGNLFMVGDEDQSIYGFRAAYPDALMRFENEHQGAKILLMEHNYRSTGEIVDAAGNFISKNRNRRPKHMTCSRIGGKNIQEINVYDRNNQFAYLTAEAERCSVKTAVLYRNNESALPLIDVLERKGIPYQCREQKNTFFSNKIVMDVTDIINFAEHPDDGELFMKIYYKMKAGINKKTAQKAAERAEKNKKPIYLDIAGYPEISEFTRKRCVVLNSCLERVRSERGGVAVSIIRNEMFYEDYLYERRMETGKLDILQLIGAFQPSAGKLLDRLEELKTITKQKKEDTECNFILSTIHASKGLEYERVFIADVIDGILPCSVNQGRNSTEAQREGEYEEERRMFYVAMTRAISELYIFTFSNPVLYSTFTSSVFNAVNANKETLRKTDYKIKTSTGALAELIKQQAKDYLPGTKVDNKSFGKGIITDKTDDKVTITFDDGSVKSFSLFVLLKNKLIKIVV